MWARRQVLNIPTFCVGSVVAVTYADKWSEHGASKFVGVCVHINPYVNTKVNISRKVNFKGPPRLEAAIFRTDPPFPATQSLRILREIAGYGGIWWKGAGLNRPLIDLNRPLH